MLTIKQKFDELKKQGRKAFIAYVPFGFPTIALSKKIILTLQTAGVDIIEIGIPFSDPIADGPIIQEATTIALKNGANTHKLFFMLQEMKSTLKVPIALMTYYNPVLKFGLEKFFHHMQKIGISGIMTVDLPVEEAGAYLAQCRSRGLETIFFITPVTRPARIKHIVKASRGFIYYISVTGITGPKDISYSQLEKPIRALKKITTVPVCVGFGVHTKEQVHRIWEYSDGAIVGSDIVKFIKEHHSQPNFLTKLQRYVVALKGNNVV
ncbi:MAG: tryptophan synthase subunit alpha [Candidatus Omnitrophota bacterium]